MTKIELDKNYNGIVEQIIRPTGLLDPEIYVRPAFATKLESLKESIKTKKLDQLIHISKDYLPSNQIDNLIVEIKNTIKQGERILVTTLTKRMAEELTNFLMELNIKVQYLHSDIETIERVEILRDLRLGKYDVVVGINLLREGLDLPEVSLVAILDADKEGFLRSYVSLTQTIGRAARHEKGRVIMYADKITDSMKLSIEENYRRRKIQEDYNKKHNITPRTVKSEIKDHVKRVLQDEEDSSSNKITELTKEAEGYKIMSPKQKKAFRKELDIQMKIYADMLEFENAAKLRDILDDIKNQ